MNNMSYEEKFAEAFNRLLKQAKARNLSFRQLLNTAKDEANE